MSRCTNILFAVLMLQAPVGWTADESSDLAEKSTFDVRDTSIRKIVQATAASQYGDFNPDSAVQVSALPPAAAQIRWQPAAEPAEGPRVFDHFDCEKHECVARDQHHAVLYSFEREDDSGEPNYLETYKDPALACQSNNNMLSTQQRLANCKIKGGDSSSGWSDLLFDLLLDLVD